MAQRHSTGLLGDRGHLLEPPAPSNNGVSPPREKCPSITPLEDSGPAAEPSTPLSTSRRIVLSTESPAALKVGTQQLIPRSLAEDPKSKLPARPHSFSDGAAGREGLRGDPKRLSAPSLSLEDELDDELDASEGSLKRNLRSMSYRAAMKGVRNGGEPEAPPAVGGLKPVLEDAKLPAGRAPARNKRTLGRKRLQHHGGSFKDDPRLYQEIREKGLNSINHESDDDLLDLDAIPEEQLPTIVVKSYRPAHTTWSQQPEVLETGILDRISPEERKRQEAIFEIITSEYSYLHSLTILVEHFLKSARLKETMTQMDHHHLFSNVGDILAVSKRLGKEAPGARGDSGHQRRGGSALLRALPPLHHLLLQRGLPAKDPPEALESLKRIEQMPECGSLPLFSFLILPMQRVTRLPLLLDTVCQKTPVNTAAYRATTQALKAISKLVKKCNEGAHTMERTEQMCSLQNQLDFGKVKVRSLHPRELPTDLNLPLAVEKGRSFSPSNRRQWDLSEGIREGNLLPLCLQRRIVNNKVSGMKDGSEESYAVLTYSMLEHLTVEKIETPDSPTGLGRSGHLFRLTLRKDNEGKPEEVVLAAES
ncbi:Rho guanine nucleotide exchange factor 16, partial [Ophiophagus hannah]